MPDRTASQRMVEQATCRSGYERRPVQEIADEWMDQFVARARKGEILTAYGEVSASAVRYVVAGGGPGAEITFVLAEGELDYAVLDYYENPGRAFRVITDADADALYNAFRRANDD